jgi:hypothetical protein
MKYFICFTLILLVSLTVSSQINKNLIFTKAKIDTTSLIMKMPLKAVLNPQKPDTTITIKLTNTKTDYLLQIHFDNPKTESELTKNDVGIVSLDTSNKNIVRHRIIEDGGFETLFGDGSKKIIYKGSQTNIQPNGDITKIIHSQVPQFIPPTNPSENDFSKYLQNVSNELLNLLSDLLKNDSVSLANFKKSEASLNIYQIIYRRIDFINYINQQK